MTGSDLLCLDVGSTFTKAVLVGADGEVRGTAETLTTRGTDVLDGCRLLEDARCGRRHDDAGLLQRGRRTAPGGGGVRAAGDRRGGIPGRPERRRQGGARRLGKARRERDPRRRAVPSRPDPARRRYRRRQLGSVAAQRFSAGTGGAWAVPSSSRATSTRGTRRWPSCAAPARPCGSRTTSSRRSATSVREARGRRSGPPSSTTSSAARASPPVPRSGRWSVRRRRTPCSAGSR